MVGLAGKRLQNAYASLQKSLQQEWDFVQSVTTNTVTAFQTIYNAAQCIPPYPI